MFLAGGLWFGVLIFPYINPVQFLKWWEEQSFFFSWFPPPVGRLSASEWGLELLLFPCPCWLQLSLSKFKELTGSLEVKSSRPGHPLGVAGFQERKLQKERVVWESNVHLNEIRMFWALSWCCLPGAAAWRCQKALVALGSPGCTLEGGTHPQGSTHSGSRQRQATQGEFSEEGRFLWGVVSKTFLPQDPWEGEHFSFFPKMQIASVLGIRKMGC